MKKDDFNYETARSVSIEVEGETSQSILFMGEKALNWEVLLKKVWPRLFLGSSIAFETCKLGLFPCRGRTSVDNIIFMSEESTIISEILKGNSVVVVGPTGSGKTYWVQNTLIPKLQELNKSVSYSKDGFSNPPKGDVTIFDESETLFDADRLEKSHSDAPPYYSEKYLKQVHDWHKMCASHDEPSIYIISRQPEDVQFLVDNFYKSDWDNRNLKVFSFPFESTHDHTRISKER
jgi:hypothetical protein